MDIFQWPWSGESASRLKSVEIHTDTVLFLTWTDALLFTNLLTSLLVSVHARFKCLCVCVGAWSGCFHGNEQHFPCLQRTLPLQFSSMNSHFRTLGQHWGTLMLENILHRFGTKGQPEPEKTCEYTNAFVCKLTCVI